MDKDSEVNRREENLGTVWGELSRVVREIHRRLFHHGDEISARLLLGRLQHILSELPEDDTAIVREEGLALYHHLKGEFALAIDHRKREIQLIERLHESLRESVSEGRYDENFASDILRTSGRDAALTGEA